MPRGDRTGPSGMGPMTGRGAGFCAGNDRPGYTTGLGYRGFSSGMGRGYRNRFYATGMPLWQRFGGQRYPANWTVPEQISPERELELRKKEIELMEVDLKAAKDYIAELEKKSD